MLHTSVDQYARAFCFSGRTDTRQRKGPQVPRFQVLAYDLSTQVSAQITSEPRFTQNSRCNADL
jgi:hypothetical protein